MGAIIEDAPRYLTVPVLGVKVPFMTRGVVVDVVLVRLRIYEDVFNVSPVPTLR